MFLPKNIFVFIFFVISIFCITEFYVKKNDDSLYEQAMSDAITGPIINESLDVSFSNVKLDGKPDEICFLFATYGKKINSDYRYELYNKDVIIDSQEFNTNILNDNDYHCFSLKGYIDESNVRDYHVKFNPINVNIDNVITLYKDKETNEVNMIFIRKRSIYSIKTIFLIVYIIIFFIINYFINKKNFKVEKMWLLYSIIYLLPILFIIPPYQVPDEPYHFNNSYQLSQINTFEVSKFISKGEIEVPSNFECLNYAQLKEKDKVSNQEDIKNCFNSTENKKYGFEEKDISPSYKIGYLISSIGIKLADFITNSPMIIFFMGRIFNFVLSVVIIYFAIKKAPKYKEMILTLGLMPMFIQQMVSHSYDSILNSVCLLIIALCISMASKDKVPLKKYYLLFTLSSIAIIGIKAIYIPLLLFIMIANDKQFKNNKLKKYLYLFSCIGISFFVAYLISLLFNTGYTGTQVINDSTNYANFLKNPMSIFTIAQNTFDRYGMFYLRGLVGYFGWFKFRIDDMFINAYVIYFIYIVLSNECDEKNIWKKLFLVLMILLMFGAVFGALYFDFTGPNKMYVDGVQGRYFLPLLLPLVVLLTPKKKILNQDLNISYNFVNIVLLQYVLMLIIFYY